MLQVVSFNCLYFEEPEDLDADDEDREYKRDMINYNELDLLLHSSIIEMERLYNVCVSPHCFLQWA